MTFCWSEFSPNHFWSFYHKMVQALLLNQISGQMSFWHFVTWEQNDAATFCSNEFSPNHIWSIGHKMVCDLCFNVILSFCHLRTKGAVTFCWNEFSPNHIWSFDHKTICDFCFNVILSFCNLRTKWRCDFLLDWIYLQNTFNHVVLWKLNGFVTSGCWNFCQMSLCHLKIKWIWYFCLNKVFPNDILPFVIWEQMTLAQSSFWQRHFENSTTLEQMTKITFCHFVTWEWKDSTTFAWNDFFPNTQNHVVFWQ